MQEDSRDTDSAKDAILFLSKNEKKENRVIFVVMQTNKSDKLYQYIDLTTIFKENNLLIFIIVKYSSLYIFQL